MDDWFGSSVEDKWYCDEVPESNVEVVVALEATVVMSSVDFGEDDDKEEYSIELEGF